MIVLAGMYRLEFQDRVESFFEELHIQYLNEKTKNSNNKINIHYLSNLGNYMHYNISMSSKQVYEFNASI